MIFSENRSPLFGIMRYCCVAGGVMSVIGLRGRGGTTGAAGAAGTTVAAGAFWLAGAVGSGKWCG